MIQNDVNYFNFVLGSWYLGASVSMTSPNLSPTNLSKQLSVVNMKVIFCNEYSLKNVEEGIAIFRRSSDKPQVWSYNIWNCNFVSIVIFAVADYPLGDRIGWRLRQEWKWALENTQLFNTHEKLWGKNYANEGHLKLVCQKAGC